MWSPAATFAVRCSWWATPSCEYCIVRLCAAVQRGDSVPACHVCGCAPGRRYLAPTNEVATRLPSQFATFTVAFASALTDEQKCTWTVHFAGGPHQFPRAMERAPPRCTRVSSGRGRQAAAEHAGAPATAAHPRVVEPRACVRAAPRVRTVKIHHGTVTILIATRPHFICTSYARSCTCTCTHGIDRDRSAWHMPCHS